MNPLHYLKGTGHQEWFYNWIMPWIAPIIVNAMYDENEIEKRIKYMKGDKDGQQGN